MQACLYSLENKVPLIAFCEGRCLTLFHDPLVDSLHTIYHEPKVSIFLYASFHSICLFTLCLSQRYFNRLRSCLLLNIYWLLLTYRYSLGQILALQFQLLITYAWTLNDSILNNSLQVAIHCSLKVFHASKGAMTYNLQFDI